MTLAQSRDVTVWTRERRHSAKTGARLYHGPAGEYATHLQQAISPLPAVRRSFCLTGRAPDTPPQVVKCTTCSTAQSDCCGVLSKAPGQQVRTRTQAWELYALGHNSLFPGLILLSTLRLAGAQAGAVQRRSSTSCYVSSPCTQAGGNSKSAAVPDHVRSLSPPGALFVL